MRILSPINFESEMDSDEVDISFTGFNVDSVMDNSTP
jgi:hypothetical protein